LKAKVLLPGAVSELKIHHRLVMPEGSVWFAKLQDNEEPVHHVYL
jgi:hypothetical protein